MVNLAEQNKDLGKLLLEEGLISEQQLADARVAQMTREKSIGRILVEMGAITEQAKMVFLNKKMNFEIVDIRGIKVPANILKRVSASYAERHCFAPLLIEGDRLVVAMEDPTNIVVIDEIKAQTGMDVLSVVAPQDDIEQIIQQYPRLTQAQADAVLKMAKTPLWLRITHSLAFVFVMMAPLVLFVFAILLSNQFSNYISHIGQPFDIGLYLALFWVLWAIILWEIDGLVFNPRRALLKD